ncbi:hypothetical protein [Demequina litorisediminis]|uniref:DNA polymerase III subunits gamma and tau n=1 Tax=Demequina litorisediminis TaxID=1849022 RepID=A0ABQ6IGW0_9MICO|nr:hypothetical protein [Demequina litorisediminis]GMA35977.1 hypothetical protein GCM10025876_21810 [Demequina litorisediminis]
MVSQSAQVASVEGGVLTLAFDNSALAGRFTGSSHAENVALAVRETLGLQVRVEATVGTAPASAVRGATPAAAASATVSAPYDDAPPPPEYDDEVISDDDERAPDAQLSGADVVAKMLGGTIIDN